MTMRDSTCLQPSPGSVAAPELSSPALRPPRRRLSIVRRCLLAALLTACWLAANSTGFGENLRWNTNSNRVSADIKAAKLQDVLGQIAAATRWQVFVEPDTAHKVSAKFSNLAPGEALRLLLGDVNFALVPGTNASSRLFVFRSARDKATQLVPPVRAGSQPIPNELIVRLKPGAKIDDIARQLGAKVLGRIGKLDAYRLQFDDPASADAARQQLADNPNVAAVGSNYTVDQSPFPAGAEANPVVPRLQLKPPPDSGRVVVGLIDTAVQPLGNNLDQFLLKQVSVAGDSVLDPNVPSHGTAMAETILRSLQNITQGNTSVQILPVDVYGGSDSTSTFQVANGIVEAINRGAKVINLSLGSPGDSPLLQEVIQSALANHILLIAAAGNQPDTTPFFPAAYPGVNAVTALDQGQLAAYASRGSFVSLAAPGANFVPFGTLAFGVQGTSVSTAYLSGLASGYMDANHGTTTEAQSYLHNNFGIRIISNP